MSHVKGQALVLLVLGWESLEEGCALRKGRGAPRACKAAACGSSLVLGMLVRAVVEGRGGGGAAGGARGWGKVVQTIIEGREEMYFTRVKSLGMV